jgi:hypothetical protein
MLVNSGARLRYDIFGFDNRHDDESRPEVPRPRGRTLQRQLGMI